jgi:hypothetical protein
MQSLQSNYQPIPERGLMFETSLLSKSKLFLRKRPVANGSWLSLDRFHGRMLVCPVSILCLGIITDYLAITVDALHEAPDIVPNITKGIPGTGKSQGGPTASGEKARDVLGIKYRDLRTCLSDMVLSLRKRGCIDVN